MSIEKLFFIRHGETDLNRELRVQGKININLNETGRMQLESTAKKFEKIHLDSIYASPLVRAVESAEIIAEKKGLKVKTLDWLVEIDHGGLEGLNREEAEEKYPGLLDVWHNCPDEAVFPGGGETARDLAERIKKGLLELIRSENGTVVLVTHQVVTGTAKCLIEGIPLSQLWKDKLINGDYLEFEITEERLKRMGF
ncbi:MAG TPA: histidine phosphatase family protein [bacterium]|nr:histidine phosphatase family protein [bacterium]